MVGLWEQREQLQKRLERESDETSLHCNQRKAGSKPKERERCRGGQTGDRGQAEQGPAERALGRGKATGTNSKFACVPVVLLTMINTFFPHKTRELGYKPHDGLRVYHRLMPYDKEEGSRI